MEILEFRDWKLEINPELTRTFYTDLPFIGEDPHCSCIYCRNYVFTTKLFPKEIQQLCSSLGIDLTKQGEVNHFYQDEDGSHFYLTFITL